MIEFCEAANIVCYTNPNEDCHPGDIDNEILTVEDCCTSASRRTYREADAEICETCPECKPATLSHVTLVKFISDITCINR